MATFEAIAQLLQMVETVASIGGEEKLQEELKTQDGYFTNSTYIARKGLSGFFYYSQKGISFLYTACSGNLSFYVCGKPITVEAVILLDTAVEKDKKCTLRLFCIERYLSPFKFSWIQNSYPKNCEG